MKKISELLSYDSDILISGVTDDSRHVKDGYLFVATKGFNVDHYDYICDAIARGAVFIICDRELPFSFPHLVVYNINKVYVDLCQKFYDVDVSSLHLIGITGTDGKTTTSSILKCLLDNASYLGTNGLEVGDKKISTSNTTPCMDELYSCFSFVQKNHSNPLCMEVSSEAILHNRISGLSFDIVGFTNITGDHLNIHKTFDQYVECKKKLLSYVAEDGYVLINGDDSILKTFHCQNLISFGFQDHNEYQILSTKYYNRSTKITLKHYDHYISIHSPFIGKYNVYNVVMAFIIAQLYGVDESLLLQRIRDLRPIKGRTEFLDFGQKYDIILDYAHTINGIQSILESVQNYKHIIVVTGCAGGRDISKRPIIGDMIMKYADVSIFTMDDPRFESVDKIIDEMVGDHANYYRIIDREDAIIYALNIARDDSVVLILGKGRDNYMAIKDKKIHYCDYDVVRNYFKSE